MKIQDGGGRYFEKLKNLNIVVNYWQILTIFGMLIQMPKQRVKGGPLDADCTSSYVLNSGVIEPNLTKFPKSVQKWLPITVLKSKLRSSNPFRNDNVT